MKNERLKLRLALIYGGVGAEREVSLIGAENVLRHIDRDSFEVYPVEIAKNGDWLLTLSGEGKKRVRPALSCGRSGFEFEGRFLPCDVAFPLLHGDMGEDGRVQGMLDCVSMKYVGCGVLAGALAADKACTKIIAEWLGIPTVRWICSDKDEEVSSLVKRAEEKIGYPMFIKPTSSGSSVGAHPVGCREELVRLLPDARESGDGRVLVETLLTDKRELECAYFSTKKRVIVSTPAEVVCQGFYDYGGKYGKDSPVRLNVAAELDEKTAELIKSYTLSLAETLRIRQIARFDYFLSEGRVFLNEVNTMPGFTESSLYAAMLEREGVPLPLFLELVTEDALS